MSLSDTTRAQIDSLLQEHPVVLFMKGTRDAPRCGFSANSVRILGAVTPAFLDVDVLADPELREGIKVYGQWPTIPQLYVRGELVGGADILSEMANSGALHELVGVPAPDRTPPTIHITAKAAEAIGSALSDAGDEVLHLGIDEHFRAQFFLKAAGGYEIRAESAGIVLHMDLPTAQRARGLEIDWVETMQGAGLSIRNPNAPPEVRPMDVQALRTAMVGASVRVIDVRPAAARALAPFASASVLETDENALLTLAKDTPLAFLCHHGQSSRVVAERFRAAGFTQLFNVEGGIDAWSLHIDQRVARY